MSLVGDSLRGQSSKTRKRSGRGAGECALVEIVRTPCDGYLVALFQPLIPALHPRNPAT